MAATRRLILDLEGAGLAASILFNGVVLAEDKLTERLSRAISLNGYALNGMNTLQVGLGLLPPPTEVPPPPRPEARFALKLRAVWPDTPDGADQVLIDYRWDAAQQPLPVGGSMEVLNQTVQWLASIPWAWTRAAPIPQLTEPDLHAIGELLAQVQAALSSRSIPDLQRLQAIQVGEQALAVGENPADFLQRYAEFLHERMAAPDWTVQPLVWEDLQVRPMAGGRLHRITDRQGRPPIVTSGSGGMFAIEPFVAKVDGRWAIVR